MIRKYHLFLALIFCASITFAQGFYPYQANKDQFTFKINPSLPEFTFSFFLSDTSGNRMGSSRIQIRRSDNDRSIQTVTTDVRVVYFQIKDMNFDGFLDLLLAEGPQGTGGASYDVWLYNSKSGTFQYDPQFAELTEPTPDSSTRMITSFYRGGKDFRSEKTFQIQNGQLIPIRLEEHQYDNSIRKFIRTRTEYHGAEGASVRVDTVNENN